MSSRRLGLVALSALALLAVVWGSARRVARAREEIRGGVSFGASYVGPLGEDVVYTRLLHAQGSYAVVRRSRRGSEQPVLPGEGRTSLRGVAGAEGAAVWSLESNQAVLLAGAPAGPARLEAPGTMLPGLQAGGRSALLLRPDGLASVRLADGALRLLEGSGRLLTGVAPDRRRFVQAALDADGRLLYVRPRGERFVLRVADLPDGRAATLVESDDILMRPAFAPGGDTATFVARVPGGWEVRRVRLADGRQSVVVRSRRFVESAELHPDGRRLLLTLGDGADFRGYMTGLHVYEQDLTTGALSRLGP